MKFDSFKNKSFAVDLLKLFELIFRKLNYIVEDF